MDQRQEQSVIANAMYEAAARYRKEPERTYLGMSSIGKRCARALWYGFRGFSPMVADGRAKMIFRLGDHIEDDVVEWLTRAGYSVSDRQRQFSAYANLFRGHWDGMIKGVAKEPQVLEIKSANSRRFKAFKAEGIEEIAPEYFAQVQCYMGFSSLSESLFIVMNKDNCELYTEHIAFKTVVFSKLLAKAKAIITANTEPEATEDLCEWCRYRHFCQGLGYATQRRPGCGTCVYCEIADDFRITCKWYQQEIKHWGRFCNEWEFRYATR